ncbi:MAG: hypothetical protein CMJ29_03150 [Phycisphaerae bacterium]|nr:hypothetical protein [Phycisphaerae bacterium]|tara:strand:+ start:122 stop:655 length:534 start_codon:yes stop_codon:yes gene_type:complete
MACADLIIDEANGIALDVLSMTGEGENTSYLVVDFDATGGDSYAFGYSWDDSSSVLDMLTAISSSTELVALTTNYGEFGTFLDNFLFGDEAGDPQNYWAHSLATPDGLGEVDWIAASGGVDVTMLIDGGISGWYNGFTEDYDVIPPSLPTIVVPAPALAPMAMLLLAITPRGRKRTR